MATPYTARLYGRCRGSDRYSCNRRRLNRRLEWVPRCLEHLQEIRNALPDGNEQEYTARAEGAGSNASCISIAAPAAFILDEKTAKQNARASCGSGGETTGVISPGAGSSIRSKLSKPRPIQGKQCSKINQAYRFGVAGTLVRRWEWMRRDSLSDERILNSASPNLAPKFKSECNGKKL